MRKKMDYPEPTVGALVADQAGRILLVRSHKWKSKFSVPGGHIELGESSSDAIKREVREEVGLDVEVNELLGVQEAIFSPEFVEKKHFIFMDYLCTSKNTDVTLDRNELQEFVWIDAEKALDLDLESYARNLVHSYIQKKKRETIT